MTFQQRERRGAKREQNQFVDEGLQPISGRILNHLRQKPPEEGAESHLLLFHRAAGRPAGARPRPGLREEEEDGSNWTFLLGLCAAQTDKLG